MHSPHSIVFENPEDKEVFRALTNDLLRLEATTKRKIDVAINDIAKYNESMLPLTLRQNKIETIFIVLDHATQALLKFNKDCSTVYSLLSSSTSKTRQATKYINTTKENISAMSEALTDNVDDLWHEFNSLVEDFDRENVSNIRQHPNLVNNTEKNDANLFDIFNTKQVDNKYASKLLEQIRAKVNSSIPQDVSVDDLNTIVVINSLSDPNLKEKILTFKCQNAKK